MGRGRRAQSLSCFSFSIPRTTGLALEYMECLAGSRVVEEGHRSRLTLVSERETRSVRTGIPKVTVLSTAILWTISPSSKSNLKTSSRKTRVISRKKKL